jgi:putative membrane protein
MQGLVFFLGLLTLAGVWFGPLPWLAAHAFSAHMVMHMSVVAVAAPLLACGVAGGRLDPVRKAPSLFTPIPVSLVELVVVWVWHTPVLHHVARHSLSGLAVEQGTFLLSGLVLWLSVFGGDDEQRRNRAAAGVLALLLTSMHMTALGVLLALPLRPLYAHVGGVAGLTPLQDQQLGGAIMLLIGGASYLVGGLRLTREVLRGTASKHEDLQPNSVSTTRNEGSSLPRGREFRTATVSRGRESWVPTEACPACASAAGTGEHGRRAGTANSMPYENSGFFPGNDRRVRVEEVLLTWREEQK